METSQPGAAVGRPNDEPGGAAPGPGFDERAMPRPRPAVPAADAILGIPIRVLDHGFVRLVDYMGGDAAVVQAAQVSYGAGTKRVSDDEALIRYLYRLQHSSPFEMTQVKLHLKAPLFVARQLVRSRLASWNEVSARYSILPDEMYLPDDAVISFQSTDNRQGRSEVAVPEALRTRVRALLLEGQRAAYGAYQELLDAGIARELARLTLPVAVYTEWYWRLDLHNLLRLIALRADRHAQYETRVYAEALTLIVERLAPLAYRAFVDYQREGVRLSAAERALVARALRAEALRPEDWAGLSRREREEFARKFELPDPPR